MRGPPGLEPDSDRGTARTRWCRESRPLRRLGNSASHPPISSIFVTSDQRVVMTQLLASCFSLSSGLVERLPAQEAPRRSRACWVVQDRLQGTNRTLHLFQDK